MAERRPPEMGFAWRLLRRVLPARFRARHGDDVLRAHVDRAGGDGAANGLRFWCALAWDVLLTGFAVRFEGGREGAGNVPGRRVARLDGVRHDLVLGARRLARQPAFALGVALTLGLGIGANVTMFSILDRLFFSRTRAR
jgi:hypothetical protein